MEKTGKTSAGITVRLLVAEDESVFSQVAEDVFDNPIDPKLCAEFLEDERHHIVLALDNTLVVGMATAVHYVHPDKAPELWINEVGVAPSHQGRGIGKKLMGALLAQGQKLGCKEAWVLTDEDNNVARSLYSSVGGKEEPERPVYFTFDLSDA